MRPGPLLLGEHYDKGEELGHFAFGSTVVALLPAEAGGALRPRDEFQMGQTLFRLPRRAQPK
jgi:hypothetical protein